MTDPKNDEVAKESNEAIAKKCAEFASKLQAAEERVRRYQEALKQIDERQCPDGCCGIASSALEGEDKNESS